MNTLKNAFYEDEYASVSVVESVPCVKIKLSGFPTGSDHYRFVQYKVLETIWNQINNFLQASSPHGQYGSWVSFGGRYNVLQNEYYSPTGGSWNPLPRHRTTSKFFCQMDQKSNGLLQS